MQWMKPRVAAVVALLILALLAWFLHSQGEEAKEAAVYCCEGPNAPDNPPGYGQGVAVIIGLSAVRAQEAGYSMPAVCKTDFTECARQLAWDKDVELECTHAVDAFKEAMVKIKAEPSLLLGANRVLSEWLVSSKCSPPNSNDLEPKLAYECYYDAHIEFYGLPYGAVALHKCFNAIRDHPYTPKAPAP